MLETDLQKMARHLVKVLDKNIAVVVTDDLEKCYNQVEYGEPKTIVNWPYLSVQPIQKARELSATRKFRIDFEIHLILYHGIIGKIQESQEGTHKRIEALERYIQFDRRWNFVDPNDKSLDKIIHGTVVLMDHPTVIAGDVLWSSSRLICNGQSEEYFSGQS